MEPITQDQNEYIVSDRQRIRLDALNLAAGVHRENGDNSAEGVLSTAEKFIAFIESAAV